MNPLQLQADSFLTQSQKLRHCLISANTRKQAFNSLKKARFEGQG